MSYPMYSKGDILLVRFPHSDMQTAKLRPVIVVQDCTINTGLSQIVVAMISSQLSRANYPTRVLLLKSDENYLTSNLVLDSVILLDNLLTISVNHTLIHKQLGSINYFDEIDKKLKILLGIS